MKWGDIVNCKCIKCLRFKYFFYKLLNFNKKNLNIGKYFRNKNPLQYRKILSF